MRPNVDIPSTESFCGVGLLRGPGDPVDRLTLERGVEPLRPRAGLRGSAMKSGKWRVRNVGASVEDCLHLAPCLEGGLGENGVDFEAHYYHLAVQLLLSGR